MAIDERTIRNKLIINIIGIWSTVKENVVIVAILIGNSGKIKRRENERAQSEHSLAHLHSVLHVRRTYNLLTCISRVNGVMAPD